MANNNCSACDDLRQSAPSFVINGIGETECASLQNNTGLNPSSGNDDCTDLNNLNDCLVGNMASEIDSYGVCDWKKFMKAFVPNVWTTLKGIICSLCGIWSRMGRYDCLINHLYEGDALEIGEDSSAGSYVVPGGGVSYKFDSESSGGRVSDVQALYIGGGLLRVQGTLRFFSSDFTDADGTARQGNSHWAETGPCVGGGELICEIRVLKSQFGVRSIYAGFGQETGGYDYSLNATAFSEGTYAYGQHGSCNTQDGTAPAGHSTGHLVEAGYTYIQLRMSSIRNINHDGSNKVSPRAFMGIRFDPNSIQC